MEELFSRDGSGPVYADSQVVVTRTRRPPGLRFAGEVDITNSDAVAQAIRIGLGDSSHAHVDVSGLSFIDVSGIRAMVEAANELGEGRQLLVHGAAPQLEMVMHVTGLAELPSVVLCRCGAESR